MKTRLLKQGFCAFRYSQYIALRLLRGTLMTAFHIGRHLHGTPRPFQSVSQGRSPGFWSYCSPAFPVLARAMAHQTPVAFRRTTSSQSRGRLWIRMACFILNHIPFLRHDAWHQSHLKYKFKCSHNTIIEVNQLRRRLA